MVLLVHVALHIEVSRVGGVQGQEEGRQALGGLLFLHDVMVLSVQVLNLGLHLLVLLGETDTRCEAQDVLLREHFLDVLDLGL